MLGKEHFVRVAKYYHQLAENSLTERDRQFAREKEQHFLNAVERDERKVDEQSQWERRQEQMEQLRDWSGLE
jgi:hypothetical protein